MLVSFQNFLNSDPRTLSAGALCFSLCCTATRQCLCVPCRRYSFPGYYLLTINSQLVLFTYIQTLLSVKHPLYRTKMERHYHTRSTKLFSKLEVSEITSCKLHADFVSRSHAAI